MAEVKKNLMTIDGLRALEAELENLKVVRRKDVAQKLKEARAQGDLSENAEYDAAKDEQRDIEARIEELEQILKYAEVIDEDNYEQGKVNVGCMVTIFDYDFEEEATYKIVGSTEADILNNKISNESAMGAALIGSTIGDEVEYEAPDGVLYKIKVLDIQR